MAEEIRGLIRENGLLLNKKNNFSHFLAEPVAPACLMGTPHLLMGIGSRLIFIRPDKTSLSEADSLLFSLEHYFALAAAR
jgi:hypothetical protein